MQYNKELRLWTANTRLAWLNTAGTGLFIVWNDGETADGFFNWGAPQTRSLVVKYARQFGTAGDGTPITGPFVEPPEITELLADARTRLEGAGVAADYLWAPGEPARIIIDVAKDRAATKIVVGHHHHSMLGRLFGTDVAADVQRDAPCEVVVVD